MKLRGGLSSRTTSTRPLRLDLDCLAGHRVPPGGTGRGSGYSDIRRSGYRAPLGRICLTARARSDLPRLSPAGYRLERLQRRAGGGAGAARARGAPALPGARRPPSSGSSTRSGRGREASWSCTRSPTPAHEGACTVYRPDIGGLLPVYVYDRYEGFEVRTFDRLTDEELDRYLNANVAAVRDVAALADPGCRAREPPRDGPGDPRAGAGGSAVRGQDPRLGARVHGQAALPALRSLRDARGSRGRRAVLVGSQHTAESLWAAMPLDELPERTRLGPPGVDVAHLRSARARRMARRASTGWCAGSRPPSEPVSTPPPAAAIDQLCDAAQEHAAGR